MTGIGSAARVRMAIVGRGSIAEYVSDALARHAVPGVECVGLVGRSIPDTSSPSGAFCANDSASFDVRSLRQLRADWVLEAAGASAAQDLVLRAEELGVGLILMSIGALVDSEVFDEVRRLQTLGVPVLTPSGAIGGLDAIEALCIDDGLATVSLTTTKAPAGWAGAPYVVQNGIDFDQLESSTIFRGSAREAILGFPANTNVAVALALAGVGLDKTRVELRAQLGASRTQHRINAHSTFGAVEVTVHSDPSPGQPRTSELAARSALAAVRSISSHPRGVPPSRHRRFRQSTKLLEEVS